MSSCLRRCSKEVRDLEGEEKGLLKKNQEEEGPEGEVQSGWNCFGGNFLRGEAWESGSANSCFQLSI
jgi:hypothetical protein